MGYPLVDMRALGTGFIGRPVPPPSRPSGRRLPFLGERAAAAVEAARGELLAAEGYLDKVLGRQAELADLVGQDRAEEAVDQAEAGVEKARRAYGDAVAVAGVGA